MCRLWGNNDKSDCAGDSRLSQYLLEGKEISSTKNSGTFILIFTTRYGIISGLKPSQFHVMFLNIRDRGKLTILEARFWLILGVKSVKLTSDVKQ